MIWKSRSLTTRANPSGTVKSLAVRKLSTESQPLVLEGDSSISARVRLRSGASSSKRLAALRQKQPNIWLWVAVAASVLAVFVLLAWLFVFRSTESDSDGEFRKSTAHREAGYGRQASGACLGLSPEGCDSVPTTLGLSRWPDENA